jgi:putative thioredoxin
MAFETNDFQRDVIERSRTVPVLVDFWAEWCGPCRILGPLLEKLAGEAGGRWELAKVDTEAHQDLAAHYGIMSIPNVKLFVNGEVADEFVGALPEAEIRRWLEEAIPSPHAKTVAAGRERLAAGDFAGAEALAAGALAAAPADPDARMLLAEALLHRDPARAEQLAAALAEERGDPLRAEAIRALARIAALEPGALPESPAREPMLYAAAAVRAGDYAGAMERILDVMRADRRYADGIARDAGRSLFVLLGLEHPVTERYQRAFGSLLHV